MYYLILIIIYPIFWFMPTKLIGRKNIRKSNCIYASNHRSNYDPIILHLKTHAFIRFLGKKELINSRLNKWFLLKIMKMIPVDRENTDIVAFKTMLKLLKQGKCLGIFPEGTRKNEDEKMQSKAGACVIAIKSKKPIIPVYIHKKSKFFRKNTIVVGEPFELSEYYSKKITAEVKNELEIIMNKKIDDLKSQIKIKNSHIKGEKNGI